MAATPIKHAVSRLLILTSILLAQSTAAQPLTPTTVHTPPHTTQKITIATAVWPNYAEQENHSGYFLTLLSLAFPAPQYQLNINYVPYPRSKQLLNNRQVDIAIGMIKGAPIYTSEYATYLGAVYHVALSKELAKQWQGTDSLIGKRVGIPRGYSALKKLPPEISPNHYKDSYDMLKMLAAGRLDAFIDVHEDIQHMFKRLNVKFATRPLPIYIPPLYMGFSETPQGAQLKSIFDQHFELLVREGKLREIMMHSGIQKQNYRFHYPCLNSPSQIPIGEPCPPKELIEPSATESQ